MKSPIYFLQRNIGFFPLTSAVVGGAIGFAVGSTGRITVDLIDYLYEGVVLAAKNFPYSLQIDPGQIISNLVNVIEGSLYHAAIDGTEAGAVYSAGSLLLAKKISNVFRSRVGGENHGRVE
jgi:hypothetical protein